MRYLDTKNEPLALIRSIDCKANYLTIEKRKDRMCIVECFGFIVNKGGE